MLQRQKSLKQLINNFIVWRKGVKEGYKNLKYKQPTEIQISIRFLLNDFIRWLYCRIFLYNTVIDRIRKLEEEKIKLLIRNNNLCQELKKREL